MKYDNTKLYQKTMTQHAIVCLWTIAQHAAIIAARANRELPWAEKWESDWIAGKYKGHYLLENHFKKHRMHFVKMFTLSYGKFVIQPVSACSIDVITTSMFPSGKNNFPRAESFQRRP